METTTNPSQDSAGQDSAGQDSAGQDSAGQDSADQTADQTASQTASQTTDQTAGPQGPAYARTPALFRPVRGRMLAGVAAGAADYLGVDPTIVRIALAVLALAGPGVPLYLAGWLLMPDEGAPQSVAADIIDSISAR